MLCSTVLLIMRPQQFPCYSPFSLPPRSLESAFIAIYGGQKAKEKKTSRNGPLNAPSAFQSKPIFSLFFWLSEKNLYAPPRNLPPFSPLPPPCLPWAKRRSGLHGRVNTSVIYWCCLAGALGNVVQTRFTNTYQLLPCGAAIVLKCKVEFFFLLKASTNVLISYSEKSIHPQHECRLFIIWWFFLLLPLKVVWGGCVCVCLPAWGLCNWHSSPHVVILSHWLSLLSKWGAVNYLLTAALFTMQLYPPRPQNRSQHDTSG